MRDETGAEVAAISTAPRKVKFSNFGEKGEIRLDFERMMLTGGNYFIDIYSSIQYGERISVDNIVNAATMVVQPGGHGSSGTVYLDCEISNT